MKIRSVFDASRRPNPMFERLVQAEDDLVGLIAYALYKQTKRDWFETFKRENKREPESSEFDSFLLGERTEKRLKTYRDQAASVLASYADTVVAEARPYIQIDAISGRIRDSLKWHRQIPAGLAAAVFFSVIVFGIAYGLRYFGIDPIAALTTPPAQ